MLRAQARLRLARATKRGRADVSANDSVEAREYLKRSEVERASRECGESIWALSFLRMPELRTWLR